MPMRFMGAPGRADIINNMIPESLLEACIYLQFMFQDVAGFTILTTGAATVSIATSICTLSAPNFGNKATLQYIISIDPHGYIFSWQRKRTFCVGVEFKENTNQEIYVLSGGSDPTTQVAIGFKIVDNAIYGCIGTIAGEHLTGVLGNFNAGDQILLKCVFIPGVEVRFYVDGVNKGALTANLPIATDANDVDLITAYLEATGVNVPTLKFQLWEFYQAR